LQSHTKAAKRYARALFDLARESGQVDNLRADMEAMRNLLDSVPGLAAFMHNYMLPVTIRTRVITELFSGRVTPLTFRFLMFTEKKKRCSIFGQICEGFIELHDQMLGIVKGRITSPFEMRETDVQSVTGFAGTKTSGKLSLSVALDPALIGGFRLRLGDIVYDASTAVQMQMLKEKMINA